MLSVTSRTSGKHASKCSEKLIVYDILPILSYQLHLQILVPDTLFSFAHVSNKAFHFLKTLITTLTTSCISSDTYSFTHKLKPLISQIIICYSYFSSHSRMHLHTTHYVKPIFPATHNILQVITYRAFFEMLCILSISVILSHTKCLQDC